MEFRKIVFPAPKTTWNWSDFKDEIFWLPIPKVTMIQLKGIFSKEFELSQTNIPNPKQKINNSHKSSNRNSNTSSSRSSALDNINFDIKANNDYKIPEYSNNFLSDNRASLITKKININWASPYQKMGKNDTVITVAAKIK